MRRLVVRAEADLEFANAIEWYKQENPAVAVEFVEAVERTLDRIQENPHQFQVIEGEARRAVMRRFRSQVYKSLIYLVTDREVIVLSCFHASRDPDVWRERIR